MSTLRAEFLYDDEARNWHFRVPALRIIGGGTQSRTEAEQACVVAIEFALEGDPDYDPAADAVALQVSVVAPSAA